MTMKNVIRLMEEKDLPFVPEAREKFRKYGHHGDYFFFVIEGDNEEIIGYLIAKKEGVKAVIRELKLFDAVEQKELYRNTAVSNLYEYLKQIKTSEGKRSFFQVCLA